MKDPRIDVLAEMSHSQKKVYAATEFVDIAWLVKWASKGEWLGNKFLANIRETDAIVQVLRYFKDPDVVHVEWSIDPMRDVEIINTELIFADLEHIERILPTLQKKVKASNCTKDEKKQCEILEVIYKTLIDWKLAHTVRDQFSAEDLKVLKSYNFLTLKPFIYALNVSQDDLVNAEVIKSEYSDKLHAPVAVVCVKIEEEMMDMSTEEKQEFMAFNTLWLMYYFTTWEKETKAWTIPQWSTAPQAAWAIHSDFERWFIKAEVVWYNDLVECGSRAKAREKWLLRLEWKSYIVQDGDVMIFKFNV